VILVLTEISCCSQKLLSQSVGVEVETNTRLFFRFLPYVVLYTCAHALSGAAGGTPCVQSTLRTALLCGTCRHVCAGRWVLRLGGDGQRLGPFGRGHAAVRLLAQLLQEHPVVAPGLGTARLRPAPWSSARKRDAGLTARSCRARLFPARSSGRRKFLGTVAVLQAQPHLVELKPRSAAVSWAPRCSLSGLPVS